jgi:hypothetical protein
LRILSNRMSQTKPQPAIGKAQRLLASLVLLALLVQVLLFFVGLDDPIHRIKVLWGKKLEERRAIVWQPGSALKAIAERFPPASRLYLMYPQPLVHWNSVYYFYPRLVTVTMTNATYRTDGEYAAWNERPTESWLITNGFNYVMNFKNGGQVWEVRPGIGAELSQAEDTNASQ